MRFCHNNIELQQNIHCITMSYYFHNWYTFIVSTWSPKCNTTKFLKQNCHVQLVSTWLDRSIAWQAATICWKLTHVNMEPSFKMIMIIIIIKIMFNGGTWHSWQYFMQSTYNSWSPHDNTFPTLLVSDGGSTHLVHYLLTLPHGKVMYLQANKYQW